MIHYRSLDQAALDNTWLTVGVFDGVHRGHAALLTRLVAEAHREAATPVVVTFHPHPEAVLAGKSDFGYLTPPDEKAALLAGLGVQAVITLPFDRTLAAESAGEFMDRLSRRLGLRGLMVGYDFALGRNREGDAHRLAEIGRRLGFRVEVLPALEGGTGVISSSAIRRLLQEGQVEQAAGLLGRPYAVSGPVIHGDGRGRSIDVPTANLAPPPGKVIPANGVYACWARIGAARRPAVTNIGTRPTFTPETSVATVEAHLLDFTGDLYDRELQLDFAGRLREERKFPSVEALVTQIRADVQAAARLLADPPKETPARPG